MLQATLPPPAFLTGPTTKGPLSQIGFDVNGVHDRQDDGESVLAYRCAMFCPDSNYRLFLVLLEWTGIEVVEFEFKSRIFVETF